MTYPYGRSHWFYPHREKLLNSLETWRAALEEHVNRDREGEMAASAERRRKALMTESGEVQWGDGFWDYAINIKHYIYVQYTHTAYINVYI